MSLPDEKDGYAMYSWAKQNMPALRLADEHVRRKNGERILSGTKIALCLHISKETSVLTRYLQELGMEIELVAANPLSTQVQIASYLRSAGINVLGMGKQSEGEYLSSISRTAHSSPQMIVDDGGELHYAYSKIGSTSCFGGTDETTTGTQRLAALDKKGLLRYPVIPVNEARTKHLFDNRYGTGQSSIDGLIRSTGLMLAGKVIVVSGYGWVGKGVATRARGMGSRVIVTEVDPVLALEAHFDGYEVMNMDKASEIGDIFLTCTGQRNVITKKYFLKMKDRAVLANCGHFDAEIDLKDLKRISSSKKQISENVAEYKTGGRSLILLCEGRVLNLVGAEGHPPEVMQLSFANQLLSIFYLALNKVELKKEKHRLLSFPKEIDDLVASFALRAFGLSIDKLSKMQLEYARSFEK